ncbi:MAG: S-layer homology domain-containing protein, partial [Lysinibacillus sp.]
MNLSKVFLAATFSLSILFANTEGTLASSTQQDSLTQNTNIANTKPFKDVSKNSTHYTAIHAMRYMGIINGYADNTFKPNDPINRQNGAALLTRYTPVKYSGTAKFPKLSDVTTKNANYKVLVEFQKLGVFNVKADGKVYPTKAMTRGEMAKGVALAFKLPIEKTTKSSFKDVKASSDYSPYIEALKKAGIATGYGDDTFKPNTTLSRAHFSAFMYRAINKVGKPTEEKPNNDTGTTAPTNPVETKPSTPTDNGSVSVGDYTKPTEYT